MKQETKENLMDKVISLCKRRGFIFPGSEIYGGLQNSWDYGPLGAELKKNIKDEWWNRFVRQRADMVGIDAALIMNPKVWEASGHLATFNDPLVECKKCHERYRPDQVDGLSYSVEKLPGGLETKHLAISPGTKCGKCGETWVLGKTLELPKQFNLMLGTHLGPVNELGEVVDMLTYAGSIDTPERQIAVERINDYLKSTVYFRPETAQAMFVQFKNILETTRRRLPFGIAQIGKAFRNEITPGNFIFRTREFEQMEIEYFVSPQDWETHFDHWLGQIKQWLKDLGVRDERLHFVEIGDGDRAHYSKRTIDVEYDYPFGQKELYGLAYRGDFDLKSHQDASKQDLTYTDPDDQKNKFLPHVIEPSFGVDRSLLVVLLEAYDEEKIEGDEADTRVVMRFSKWLAPVKVAILPLSKKEELAVIARPLFEQLSKQFVCDYDETQSIGKRYRRQDEIGTPFCVTVDFETANDQAVTVRDRDTMKQERIKMSELSAYLQTKF